MRIFAMAIGLVLAGSVSAFANCSLYGNCYTTNGDTTYGTNAHTGSTWQSTNEGPVTNGIDRHGNAWSYDRSTGSYENYGTGVTRQHTPCYGYNCR